MKYAIEPWALPSVPIAHSTAHFPVRHIYCVGRNYAEHAKEMGGDAAKEPPLIARFIIFNIEKMPAVLRGV